MGKFKGIFLVGVLMFSTLMLITNPLQYCSGVQAYYTDIKSLGGCSITAPAQSTAVQSITVIPQNSTISKIYDGNLNGNNNKGEDGKKFTDFQIKNTDPQNTTTITSIQVAVTNPSGITMSGINFNTGNGNGNGTPFGAVGNYNADGTLFVTGSYSIASGVTTKLGIDFSENMFSHRPFTITFTFSDGSVKTITGITPN